MSGPSREAGKAYLNQLAYVWGTDTLPCCGCVAHSGVETSDCDCRCHETGRLWANPVFTEVKR